MPRVATARTGAAGEFYVAAQLSARGWAASVLLGNSPRSDILAQHPETGRTIGVQSKAANMGGDFQAGAKADVPSPPSANGWFVFVGLRDPGRLPDFFVVPRNVMAAFCWAGHQAWLRKPSRTGGPHRPNTMRNIRQRDLEPYRDRWDDLHSDPDEVPAYFRGGLWEWVEQVGLPDGHPGLIEPSTEFLAGGDP